ncbi:hypothetical protein KVR01_009255 [Diaporthe batatas]|uniref:uncharacterized protein n=1 Tax=Diaporthe batatas TaxID=748121 RepID=UPI001D038CC8|nr:uncharacterized protein KVR01_009255 [Diaporthe batatas]KAG8160991.1 hypothetical protein KVR01_009255 [Diaporthe batatas]
MDPSTLSQPEDDQSGSGARNSPPAHRRGIYILIGKVSLLALANDVVAAAQHEQQHPEDKGAVMLFRPVGKYALQYVRPRPPSSQPGQFNPLPTSLMSLPSRRDPHSPQRPFWVDFYVHSTPQPAGDHQAKSSPELNSQASGPSTPCWPTLYLLATTLGRARLPAGAQDATTLLGRPRGGWDDHRRKNFGELLLHLAGHLRLARADDAVAAEMEVALGAGAVGGDLVAVEPGFMAVVRIFLRERVAQAEVDGWRSWLQGAWARIGPIPNARADVRAWRMGVGCGDGGHLTYLICQGMNVLLYDGTV